VGDDDGRGPHGWRVGQHGVLCDDRGPAYHRTGPGQRGRAGGWSNSDTRPTRSRVDSRAGGAISLPCCFQRVGVAIDTPAAWPTSSAPATSRREHGNHVLLWTANAGALDELRLLARQGLIDGALLMEVRPRGRTD